MFAFHDPSFTWLKYIGFLENSPPTLLPAWDEQELCLRQFLCPEREFSVWEASTGLPGHHQSTWVMPRTRWRRWKWRSRYRSPNCASGMAACSTIASAQSPLNKSNEFEFCLLVVAQLVITSNTIFFLIRVLCGSFLSKEIYVLIMHLNYNLLLLSELCSWSLVNRSRNSKIKMRQWLWTVKSVNRSPSTWFILKSVIRFSWGVIGSEGTIRSLTHLGTLVYCPSVKTSTAAGKWKLGSVARTKVSLKVQRYNFTLTTSNLNLFGGLTKAREHTLTL